ncbi:MAG: carbamoyltransferase HypF [Coriobacteriales bacterium]|jgi:hydrogenase maturation protein HypF
MRSIDVHITGRVQGVGFRPHVLRAARRNLVAGWVRNAGDGVELHAEGDEALVASFLIDLEADAPAASRVESVVVEDTAPQGCADFEILPSHRESPARGSGPFAGFSTHISADLATCPDCLGELLDPESRRYHYPFINCTSCGPRFTIIDGLPYDRPRTSMREFEMCPDCAAEYADESDRRFHAQPDACFMCGPSLSLSLSGGKTLVVEGATLDERRAVSDAIISRTCELLRAGKIVAVKGLGGYHLACDAGNETAVGELRRRKNRLGKPFAIMARDTGSASEIAFVSAREQELLESPAAPIVLLERRRDPDAGLLAPSVCLGLAEVGIMLPATPLQHLLARTFGGPLVMTSGNLSDEPIAANPPEAHARLGSIADAFLDNDREILSRYDDSVLRVVDGHVQFARRARGYAPEPLPFPRFGDDRPAILAVGAEQKGTFALAAARSDEAIVSQHLGDLEHAESLAHWMETLSLYERLFDIHPAVAAHDLHPGYLATKWALANASRFERLTGVQHHHAHIAAVIGEHLAAGTLTDADERVIGIALDGTGYGTDGTVWGGEVLVATARECKRVAHLATFPLIGGESAIRQPLRQAYGLLARCGLLDHPAAARMLAELGDDTARALDELLATGAGCIETSSAGRLFDAMSGLLGICTQPTYGDEAPMQLEAAICRDGAGREPDEGAPPCSFALRAEDWNVLPENAPAHAIELDPQPVVGAMLDGLGAGIPTGTLSRWFHEALADALVETCCRVRETTGLRTVALSGGVFANRFLRARIAHGLGLAGFTVLEHIQLPPNDGCISYGQAVVAAASMNRR